MDVWDAPTFKYKMGICLYGLIVAAPTFWAFCPDKGRDGDDLLRSRKGHVGLQGYIPIDLQDLKGRFPLLPVQLQDGTGILLDHTVGVKVPYTVLVPHVCVILEIRRVGHILVDD